MTFAAAGRMTPDGAHEHRGNLYIPNEDSAATASRIRAHLRDAFPHMQVKMSRTRTLNGDHFSVSICRYEPMDISDSDAWFRVRRLVYAELERFTRYDWDPLRGSRNLSLSFDTSIDPAICAAALNDVPEPKPLVSFAEFTRTARSGDQLEHVAGKEPPDGARILITAISARRLTTRPVDAKSAVRDYRVPIQGGACFASDGDLVCFKHSGFAHQGGYSLMRWLRQPLARTDTP